VTTLSAIKRASAQGRVWLAQVLCPQWRIYFVLIATIFLYDAVGAVSPGQGKITLWQSVQGIIFGMLCFATLWAAIRPRCPTMLTVLWGRLPPIMRWRGWRAMYAIALVLILWNDVRWQVGDVMAGRYHNDAISFVHMDADLVLHGRNPYTADDAFWTAIARWPATSATALLGSTAFGSDPLAYPSFEVTNHLLVTQLQHPATRGNDFDPRTVHNYPAGIILLALPFVWAGVPSLVWLNLIALLGMFALVLVRADVRHRPALALMMVLNPALALFGFFVNFDVVALVFVLAAWHWFQREIISALLIGFACAVKQIAWFVAPFYLLAVARREGPVVALRRAGWMLLAFLVPNLPFIIASPSAWAHSQLVPLTDSLFPLGFGAVTLAMGGGIPFGSPHLWTLAVLVVLAGLLAVQWRRGAPLGESLLLALVPLWFSWRSPMNYFALLPVLAAWVVAGYLAPVLTTPEPPPAIIPEQPPMRTVTRHEYVNRGTLVLSREG